MAAVRLATVARLKSTHHGLLPKPICSLRGDTPAEAQVPAVWRIDQRGASYRSDRPPAVLPDRDQMSGLRSQPVQVDIQNTTGRVLARRNDSGEKPWPLSMSSWTR
jgi:hypothetical protein